MWDISHLFQSRYRCVQIWQPIAIPILYFGEDLIPVGKMASAWILPVIRLRVKIIVIKNINHWRIHKSFHIWSATFGPFRYNNTYACPEPISINFSLNLQPHRYLRYLRRRPSFIEAHSTPANIWWRSFTKSESKWAIKLEQWRDASIGHPRCSFFNRMAPCR